MSDRFPTFARFFRAIDEAPKVIFLALYDRRRSIALIVIVLLALHLAATITTGIMVSRQIANALAAGELPTYESFLQRASLTEENAASLYLKAFDALRFSRNEEKAKDLLEWGPEWTANARQLIAANPDALKWLEEASRIRPLAPFFVPVWSGPTSPEDAVLSTIYKSGTLLEARAAVAIADGKPDEALEACSTLLRISDQEWMQPGARGLFTLKATAGRAARILEKILSRADPSPGACRRLFEQVGGIDPGKRLVRAAKEGVWRDRFELFHKVRSGETSEIEAELRSQDRLSQWVGLLLRCERTVCRPLLNVDELIYLRAVRKRIRALELPWPQSRQRLKEIEKEDSLQHSPWIISWYATLGWDFYPKIQNETAARLAGCQIALALKAYKVERGRYPDSLGELEKAGWKLPKDPFTGKPLHYRKEDGGFLVWSLGPDMRDNGGLPRRPKYRKGEYVETPYDIPLWIPQ